MPLSEEQLVVATDNERKPKTPAGDKTILIVEDEDLVAEVIITALSDVGYKTLRAANGKDGLGLFLNENHKVKLIISDVIMPEMSGPDMVKAISSKGHTVPVLFLSGYTDANLTELHEKSRAELLKKPFSLADLYTRVEQLIQ